MIAEEELCPLDGELQSLKAIFGEELEVNKSEKDGNTVDNLVVHMSPESTKDDNSHFVLFEIVFEIPSDYPQVPPKMSFKNVRGLSEEAQNRTETNMKNRAEELTGSAMLFELIQVAKEQLTSALTPSILCAICLFGFAAEDKFERTPCFHFFHSHCLASHVKHTLAQEDDLSEKGHPGDDAPDETQGVLCPVCRVPIPFDDPEPENFPAPKESLGAGGEFQATPELRQMQDQMASLYSQQKAKGSIIDLEAEKNKFFIEISNTPDITVLPCSSSSNSPVRKVNETISTTGHSTSNKHIQNSPEHFRKHLDTSLKRPVPKKQENLANAKQISLETTESDAKPDARDSVVDRVGIVESDPKPVADWSQESEDPQKPVLRRNKKGPRRGIGTVADDNSLQTEDPDRQDGPDSERNASAGDATNKPPLNKGVRKYRPWKERNQSKYGNSESVVIEETDGTKDGVPNEGNPEGRTKFRGGERYKRPFGGDRRRDLKENEKSETFRGNNESTVDTVKGSDLPEGDNNTKTQEAGRYGNPSYGDSRKARYQKKNENPESSKDENGTEPGDREVASTNDLPDGEIVVKAEESGRYKKPFQGDRRRERYTKKNDNSEPSRDAKEPGDFIAEDNSGQTGSRPQPGEHYRKPFSGWRQRDRFPRKNETVPGTVTDEGVAKGDQDAHRNTDVGGDEKSQDLRQPKKPYYKKYRKPRNFEDGKQNYRDLEPDCGVAADEQNQTTESMDNRRVAKPKFKKNRPRNVADQRNSQDRTCANDAENEGIGGDKAGSHNNEGIENIKDDTQVSKTIPKNRYETNDRQRTQMGSQARNTADHRYNRRNNWPTNSTNRYQNTYSDRPPRTDNRTSLNSKENVSDFRHTSEGDTENSKTGNVENTPEWDTEGKKTEDIQETNPSDNTNSKHFQVASSSISTEFPRNRSKFQKHENRYRSRDDRKMQDPNISDPNTTNIDNAPDGTMNETASKNRYSQSSNSDDRYKSRPYQQRYPYNDNDTASARYNENGRYERPRNWQNRPNNRNYRYQNYNTSYRGDNKFGETIQEPVPNSQDQNKDCPEEESRDQTTVTKSKPLHNNSHKQNSYTGDWSEPNLDNRNVETTANESPQTLKKTSSFSRTHSYDGDAPENKGHVRASQSRYQRTRPRWQGNNYRDRAASSPIRCSTQAVQGSLEMKEDCNSLQQQFILPFVRPDAQASAPGIPPPFSKNKRSLTDP